MGKTQGERFKTMHDVFDEFTNRNIYKLISEGHFAGLVGPVSTGKEANVFLARKEDKTKVIVKIHRLETSDFNRMYDYLKYDPRYATVKKKRREIIFAWAQREYRNLLIARESGVRAPTPLTLKSNIVVMEYIGDKEPAPKLKDSIPMDLEEFSSEVVNFMKKLYKGGYIHGDLSAFNILNWNQKPVFIDFSGCTPLRASDAEDLLVRDVKNVIDFFNKKGLELDKEKVLKKIRK